MESRTYERKETSRRRHRPTPGRKGRGEERRMQGRGVRSFTEELNSAKKWTPGIPI
ncbi:hypothetical protein YC2023_103172 [Brassica napus]